MKSKKNLYYHIGVFIFIFLLVGCSQSNIGFVNHSPPEVNLSFDTFENIGCPLSEYGFRNCEKSSPLYALDCNRIKEPSYLLGALKPAYPIALCITNWRNLLVQINSIDDVYQKRCNISPDNVCFNINEMVREGCIQSHSNICDSYYEAIEEKCIRSPEDICDRWDGVYEIREQVLDTLTNIEHIAIGNYIYNPEGEYFFMSGGLGQVFFRYVILQEDKFVLIKTESEFREIFAPIETKEEALGYVKAVTGLRDYYGLEFNPEYQYFVNNLEDTHVEITKDGYLVNLYYNEAFGCGPHPTYNVDFQVTSQGYIQQMGTEKVFTDPSQDEMCVD